MISVRIGIFYSIFYAALAALLALCMWVFFQTLDPRIPKRRLEDSLIDTSPGKHVAIKNQPKYHMEDIADTEANDSHIVSRLLQDLVFVQCPRARISRVHWFGTEALRTKTTADGQMHLMNSSRVRAIIV